MKLFDFSSPLVVLDRCVLKKHIGAYIPDDAHVLLCDTYFHEASQGKDSVAEMEAFNKWARKYRNRIWIGGYWDSVSRSETVPGKFASRDSIIAYEFTQRFRDDLSSHNLDWTGVELIEDYANDRKRFVQICKRFGDWVRERNSNELTKIANDESLQYEWIRSPDQVADYVISENQRFQEPSWASCLRCFPDKLAVCRWSRIIVWNCLMHAIDQTHRFENNWDDAHYAFAASYTGKIATTDAGLIKMMKAIFPSCELLTAKQFS